MATSRFESLPVEVFEAINSLLDLRDLCNIRLVSRSMTLKVTQSYFGSLLRSRSVKMTRPALESMAELTANGRIGCFVENLTLTGVLPSYPMRTSITYQVAVVSPAPMLSTNIRPMFRSALLYRSSKSLQVLAGKHIIRFFYTIITQRKST